jgi:flagellar biosynthesis protein FlhF
MRILKFEGATMRDAIAKVKAELGDQAVIIATRQVRKGLLGTATEISAAVDDDDAPQQIDARRPLTNAYGGPSVGGPAPAARGSEQDLEKSIAPLRSEMRSLRALVRTSGDSRGNAELKNELAELRKLVEDMRPAQRPVEERPAPKQAASLPRRAVADHAPDDRAELTRPSLGRLVMLVGPTGAGKTTTIAKLAANAALVEGKRVKLVTLDNFRVGGVEQIRTFADLIGVPLEVVDDMSQLADALDESYDLILIDTAGRSPRETAPVVELAEILGSLPPIEVHVVVPASTSAQAIDSLVARYRRLEPARLLFTKLDEVDQITELTRAPVRTQLPITWVTTGQAVPEDLEQPTRARLTELAGGSLAHRAA